jgi:hypothetical protein
MPAALDDRSRSRAYLAVVTLIVLAGCATLAVLGAIVLSHSSTRDDAREAARNAGGQLAVDFSSVDYGHLHQFCQQNAPHATAAFAGSCGREISTLRSLFGSSKVPSVVSTSSVQATALKSFTPTAATVLVALQETLHGASSGAATNSPVQDIRVQIDLVKQHGDWLVNGLRQV